MEVKRISNTPSVQFGYKMPDKKTYKAMQSYYELITDKSSAMEYRLLHNTAKSRLHYMRFLKAKESLGKFEEYPKGGNFKEQFNYLLALAKQYGKMAFEKLSSVYYNAI